MKVGSIKCDNPYNYIIGKGYIAKKLFKELPYRHYMSSKIMFDGNDYYLSISINTDIDQGIIPNSCNRFILNDEWNRKSNSGIIGIDLGAKTNNWAVDSNGGRLYRPDQHKEDKRIKRLQKKYSRQLRINDKKMEITNPSNGDNTSPKRKMTKNEKKTLYDLNKAYRRKTNKKLNAIHNYCCNIIEQKPTVIVMENLKIKEDMIEYNNRFPIPKRQKANSIIYEAMMYTFRHIMEEKADNNNIPIILAPSDYKSTQTCSCCGHEMNMDNKKWYNCPKCGMKLNRDENSAYNLRNYGYSVYYNTEIPRFSNIIELRLPLL